MMAARSSVLPPEPSVVLGEDDMAYSSAPTHDELRAAASAIGAFSSSKSSRALMGELAFEKRKDKFLTKMEMVLENVLRMKIDERQLECIFVLVIQSATDYLWCSDEERRARTVQEVCTKLLSRSLRETRNWCCSWWASWGTELSRPPGGDATKELW